MPLDLSPFVQGHAIEPERPMAFDPGTYQVHKNGLQDMLVRILQAHFPEAVAGGSGQLTNESPGPGAVADFGTLSGKIRAQPRSTDKDFIVRRDAKGNVIKVNGATTQDVLAQLPTLLHEIYHSRAAKAPGGYVRGAESKGAEWQLMLENASAAGFPSIQQPVFGGDKLEEFLATATAVKQMQAKGIPVVGTLEKAGKNLQQLEMLHPWLSEYIDQRAAPEKMKPAEK